MVITVKEVPPMMFLASVHRTTIPQIAVISDKISPQLFAAADQNGLSIAGPMQFHYDGIDADLTKEFELIIAVPIVNKPECAPPPFSLLETEAFPCAALDFVGPMSEIQRGYLELMAGMKDRNLTMSSRCREVYKHWVGIDSPDNVTELQYGIA